MFSRIKGNLSHYMLLAFMGMRMIWLVLMEPSGALAFGKLHPSANTLAGLAAVTLPWIVYSSVAILAFVIAGAVCRKKWAYYGAFIFGAVHALLVIAIMLIREKLDTIGPIYVLCACAGMMVFSIIAIRRHKQNAGAGQTTKEAIVPKLIRNFTSSSVIQKVAVVLMALQLIVKLTIEIWKSFDAIWATVPAISILMAVSWVLIILACLSSKKSGYLWGGIMGIAHIALTIPLPLIEVCDHYAIAIIVAVHGLLISVFSFRAYHNVRINSVMAVPNELAP